MKPLVEKPFLPEEVDKLANLKQRKIFSDDLQVAQIVGSTNNQPGVAEVNLFLLLISYIFTFFF